MIVGRRNRSRRLTGHELQALGVPLDERTDLGRRVVTHAHPIGGHESIEQAGDHLVQLAFAVDHARKARLPTGLGLLPLGSREVRGKHRRRLRVRGFDSHAEAVAERAHAHLPQARLHDGLVGAGAFGAGHEKAAILRQTRVVAGHGSPSF